MRFIDNLTLTSPTGWDTRSESAKNKVLTEGKDVENYARVWKDLKDGLADLSSNKCWYCEMPQIRSDNAVDHFRPKQKYPWRAFDKKNFRYACTFCNSERKNPETGVLEGKGDKFPLFDESKRSTCEREDGREDPILLDPCEAHDPRLLDFLVDGKPTARSQNSNEKHRVDISIQLYHLDHPALIEERRVLALKINEIIELADSIYPEVATGTVTIKNAFKGYIKQIANIIATNAKLSSFAKKIVLGHRDKEWVELLLEAP